MTIADTIKGVLGGGTTIYVVAAGAALVAGLAGAGWWLHHSGYNEGRDDAKQAALIAQQAAQSAMQQEKDLADANYRGAVLARQAAEAEVTDLHHQVVAGADRIAGLNGLLQQYRNRAKAAATSGRPDGARPDWIGIFGQCIARVESLSGRLADVGKDAARWADQVNGLQGYVRALQSGTDQPLVVNQNAQP